MNEYIKDAVISGGARAANEIHAALVRSGAIEPRENIIVVLAKIIVTDILADIANAEKAHEKGG